MNDEAYSSFEGVSFDHKIISAKICLSLCGNKKQADKISWYNWSSVASSDINDIYTAMVRNKFDTLQKTLGRLSPNDKYEIFVTYIEAANQPNQE